MHAGKKVKYPKHQKHISKYSFQDYLKKIYRPSYEKKLPVETKMLFGTKFFYLCAALILIALVIFSFSKTHAEKKVIITNSYGQKIAIYADIAETSEEKAKGLGGRLSMPEDYGMLYPFEDKNTVVALWMKGMKYNLDWIFIKEGGIAGIIHDIPPCSDSGICQKYAAPGPVDYIIEVNGGFVKSHNIADGDKFELK